MTRITTHELSHALDLCLKIFVTSPITAPVSQFQASLKTAHPLLAAIFWTPQMAKKNWQPSFCFQLSITAQPPAPLHCVFALCVQFFSSQTNG